jgi:hypothetical protein
VFCENKVAVEHRFCDKLPFSSVQSRTNSGAGVAIGTYSEQKIQVLIKNLGASDVATGTHSSVKINPLGFGSTHLHDSV